LKKVTAAIDKALNDLAKRLSVFDHYHDGGTDNDDNNSVGFGSSNWDMINAAIAEHDGDPWYIPKDNVVNAWTSQIHLTVGDIDLRDFALERKFSDMRHERVQEYDRKWREALDKNDKDYLSKHVCPGLDHSFWDNWTDECMYDISFLKNAYNQISLYTKKYILLL
jgi:hypothetical protein